ncbi:MAG TPA: YkgJ family cysteine cluster protein [Xanthomonadaceae bacterium]|nr:YkgJ family cysteine cluster protein [Xanthomonadaceae bacterium]
MSTNPTVPPCRPQCAACCIAPSISSPIPGMPDGKPAGVPCKQLDDDLRCRLFGRQERPGVCVRLRPEPGMCGKTREEALATLGGWEALTSPAMPHAGAARVAIKRS